MVLVESCDEMRAAGVGIVVLRVYRCQFVRQCVHIYVCLCFDLNEILHAGTGCVCELCYSE